jgi:hypothetical protein
MFSFWMLVIWLLVFVYVSSAFVFMYSISCSVWYHRRDKELYEKWLIRAIISSVIVFSIFGLFKNYIIG